MMGQFLRRLAAGGMHLGGVTVGFHLHDNKEDPCLVWYDGTFAARQRAQHALQLNPSAQVEGPAL